MLQFLIISFVVKKICDNQLVMDLPKNYFDKDLYTETANENYKYTQ